MKNIFFMLTGIMLFVSAEAQTQKVSDRDLKTEAAPVSGPLAYLLQLEPVSFRYKESFLDLLKLPSGQQYGFIAEDVQKVLPSIVKNESKLIPAGKNSFKTLSAQKVDVESLIPLLVGAMQEQQAEIEKLKSQIQSLKSISSGQAGF